MASLVEELITILKQQKQSYDELLILSNEKKSIILKNDIDTLQKITAAESTIVGRNQKLDQKREECVKNIGTVINRNPKELTITELAIVLKAQNETEELIRLRDGLKIVLEELKLKNDQNRQLLESSLDYVNFSVNLIRGKTEGGREYYSPTGEIVQEGKNFFDIKQ
jgi:flagellar biosynthesis/type III secretory pathway chaperone